MNAHLCWRKPTMIFQNSYDLPNHFNMFFLTTSLTKPCKVNSNFLAKIFPDVVQRLVFEPFSPASPISVKNLSGIQMWRRCAWTRIFKWTLKKKLKNKYRGWKLYDMIEVIHGYVVSVIMTKNEQIPWQSFSISNFLQYINLCL